MNRALRDLWGCVLAALVLSSIPGRALAAPASGCGVGDDSHWSDGFKLPVHNGSVFAVLPDGDDLIVGGSFTQTGSTPARFVARWDGAHWSSVGDGLPMPAYALARWNGRLIAGVGNGAGPGIDVPQVYELVGTQWQPLGTMRDGYVRALAVYDGDLIAGGSFTHADGQPAGRVARWDGSAWHPMGNVIDLEVRHLLAFGGRLVAAGTITPFGDIAQWDGSAWSGLGAGFQGTNHVVMGLATDGVRLYASGSMETSGSITFTGLPTWDGATWSSLGTSSGARRSYSLAVHDGAVHSADFDLGVQRWNGSGWTDLDDFFAGPPNLMVSWGDKLIAARGIGQMPVRMLNDIAVHDGTTWAGLFEEWAPGSAGHYSGVETALSWNGQLVVGGGRIMGAQDHFEITSGVSAWNGSSWGSLGAPLVAGTVRALAEWDGDLVAGGSNILGNVSPTRHIARWNGSSWVALGQGLSSFVYGLAPRGADLVAVGIFTSAVGGPTLNGVGRWDGTSWSPLGTGFTIDFSNGIYPRAVLAHGGDVIVSGAFSAAGGVPAANVARWDGASWTALGSGLDGPAHALESFGGDVIVGGYFTHAGGVPATGVARWNGTSWSAMGTNAIAVEALRVIDGRLFGAGRFLCPDASEVAALALWDGSKWKLLGSGFDDDAHFRTIAHHAGDVYVGGWFTRVAGKPSFRIARWSGLETVVEVPAPRAVAPLELRAPHPNPSTGPVALTFALPRAAPVRLVIHDLAGREVAVAANGRYAAGEHRVTWSGRGSAGERLPAGVYWSTLSTAAGTRAVRLVRLN